MSELCLTSPSKTQYFPSLLISDLFLFCSFILSHPLYFSYFIFFSPYLFKLVSFLSPLFITTFLLFLSLFTGFVHDNFLPELSKNRVDSLLAVYAGTLESLKSRGFDEDEEFCCLEEFEVYKIVFDVSSIDVGENPFGDSEERSGKDRETESPVFECSLHENHSVLGRTDDSEGKIDENSAHIVNNIKLEKTLEEIMGKSLEKFLNESDGGNENVNRNVESEKVEPLGPKIDKVVEKQKEEEETTVMSRGSEVTGNGLNDVGEEKYMSKVKLHSYRLVETDSDLTDKYTPKGENSPVFGQSFRSNGSMRKEKEWKRTLACKLFEERHNVDGGEGMDSLWEAYEMDAAKAKARNETNKKKSKKKRENEYYKDEGDNEDEEDDEIDGQLCCLQALKLSAGKMNLGMGRPNLVKISKAIKGLGWLHRSGRKVHNNGDKY